jgi:hypothetical protein
MAQLLDDGQEDVPYYNVQGLMISILLVSIKSEPRRARVPQFVVSPGTGSQQKA